MSTVKPRLRGNPETFADFVDLVVPELQKRGRYKLDYAPGTLRTCLARLASACATCSKARCEKLAAGCASLHS
jgi:hypothetical protein